MKLFSINSSYINSNNIYVGNLNSVYVDSTKDFEDQELMYKDGKVNYIFEKRKDNYYEIFTGTLIKTEESCHQNNCFSSNINQLYLVNIKPLKNVVPDIKDKFSRQSLIYLFDSIN